MILKKASSNSDILTLIIDRSTLDAKVESGYRTHKKRTDFSSDAFLLRSFG